MDNENIIIKYMMENIPQNNNLDTKRKLFIEKGNYIEVNKIISYGLGNGYMHIHVAPATDLNSVEKAHMLKDGLKKLAVVVLKNESIKNISATSWIVLKKPKLLEEMGFRIDNSIETQMLTDSERFRKSDKRKAAVAIISRDDFIQRYL